MDAAVTADGFADRPPPDRVETVQAVDATNDQPLQGLVLLAQFHGIAADSAQLRHDAGRGNKPFDETALLLAAKRLGLKAKVVRQPAERLDRVALPALALMNDGAAFVVAKVDDEKVLIHDLALQRPGILSRQDLRARYDGRLLVVASRASMVAELAKFDFSWFIPAVVKYRKLLLEVLVVSFFLQLFALVTPLFFQVVMDKVLVHHAMTTLTVITVGLVVITLFNVVLSGLRTYVFAHTTSRIDVELGARLFRHILALPLAYFESRRVGDTIARVRELENIRNFLTGQTLTSALDLLFTFVFLAVMFLYSGWLTLIVVISLPLYAIWSAAINPTLRARLNEKFVRSADNQSFLVETIAGIGTVKAMAVDPRMVRTWDSQLAGYVSAGFRVTHLANIGQQGVQLLQKLVGVAILYWGAQMVIDGTLSVGQLIAFTMLSGQVSTPIVRLAQLWQDFQQVGISMERMGDILNTRTEADGSRMALPPIQGRITF
jgi:ATP-binding cassette, subfamily B, bacterial HlyB/CyaB